MLLLHSCMGKGLPGCVLGGQLPWVQEARWWWCALTSNAQAIRRCLPGVHSVRAACPALGRRGAQG